MLKDILKTMKIKHYVKNIVVLIPLFFSKSYVNIDACIYALIAVFAFCLVSSAVYIMNDIIDIENDRKHPVKSKRPIASGKITITQALSLFIILLFSSLIISYLLNPLCSLMIFLYLLLNIFYSLKLKHVILIDAACIATGFIFRIVVGCYAINVIPSPLVILMTFFVSNFFTCIKRKLELQLIEDGSPARQALKGMNVNTMNLFILMNAVLSVSFYITYVLDVNTMQKVNSQYLYLTVLPFTLIVYRLFFLVNSKQIDDDPIIYLEKDKITKYLILFYVLLFIVISTILK